MIFVIKHETTFGPFFSTREKAIAYLESDEDFPAYKYTDDDPYVSILEVKIDDENVCYDG